MPKQTLRFAPMFLHFVDPQRLSLRQPFPDQMRPTERQRQQRQQLGQSLWVSHLRLFQTESPTLQTREQRFYCPAHTIIFQRGARHSGRSNNHVLARRQAHPAEIQIHSPALACALNHQWRTYWRRAKQAPNRHQLAALVPHLRVLFDPEAKGGSQTAYFPKASSNKRMTAAGPSLQASKIVR